MTAVRARLRLLVALLVLAWLAAPPVAHAASLQVGIRVQGGSMSSCRGVAGACTLATLRRTSLELRALPVGAASDTRVALQLSWRRPGTARLRPRSTRLVTIVDQPVGRRMQLAGLVRAPGTWCIRARLVDAAGIELAAPPPTCVRYRPPIELGWAGDIVVGSSYGLPPNGGRDQFRQVSHLLRRPDLMIGNYEGTLSTGGVPRCGGGSLCYLFQAPPERARNLRDAGFDVMNLANNHALDMGAASRRQTVAVLRGHGIAAAGLPGRVTVVQVDDTRVALVGMSPYPGTTSMRQPDAIRALVRDARRRGDVVVMLMHAGLEGAAGAHVPHGADYGTDTRGAARTAIDAGADVVFGSGPHVVRGVERHRGRFIVYSSGNFAGWHNFGLGALTSQSGVVRMAFDHRGRPTRATWDAVTIRHPGIPRPDRSGRVLRRVASLSRADFGRRGARFTRAGAFR